MLAENLKSSGCILQSGYFTYADLHTFSGHVYRVDPSHADHWFTTLELWVVLLLPNYVFLLLHFNWLPILPTAHPDSLLFVWGFFLHGIGISDISDRPQTVKTKED